MAKVPEWVHPLCKGLVLCGGFRGGVAEDEATCRLVAGLLEIPETDVRVQKDGRGKPLLDPPVRAGLSRSRRDGLTLLGAEHDAMVGVDLERIRDDIPHVPIADAFFYPEEADMLRSAPLEAATIFAWLWTAKEAVLKSDGRGVAAGLRCPELRGLDWLNRLRSGGPSTFERGPLRLVQIPVTRRHARYVAALCVIAPDRTRA